MHKITKGVETWIGGCRKSTSRQPPNTVTSLEDPRFKGADDWEWNDGTPWSFTSWNDVEPNNGANNISGVEDRVSMSGNTWFDRGVGKLNRGIYRKPRYLPPFKAILSLVSDQYALPKCFTASDQLRRLLVRILYRTLSTKDTVFNLTPPVNKAPTSRVNPTLSAAQAIAVHLNKEWTDFTNAIRTIHRAPPELSANDRYRDIFLSHIVAASAILDAPAPNEWKPIGKSADDWSWPPAPLIPLRAAAKIIQNLGPNTIRSVWLIIAAPIVKVLIRMVNFVRADTDRASGLLAEVYERLRKASLRMYHKQLKRARRDPTYPEFNSTANYLMKQLGELQRKQYRVQTISSFPELYSSACLLLKRFNDFLAALALKCARAQSLKAPLKGIGRALEKLVLRPGAAVKIDSEGLDAIDASTLVDVLRGSLECPDFTEIVFILDLLELLDVELGDPVKAKAQGWELGKFQIRIVNIKNRFDTPTSGGWADAMVNFCFVHGDDTHHVMELQLQVWV